MSTPMSQGLGPSPFPPLSSVAPVTRTVTRTVFDNGVEAEIGTFADRRPLPRDDQELLTESLRALRESPNVPPAGVAVRVIDGTIILDGRTAFYYERAAAECAVRFLDGVRAVENHIIVEPPALAHVVRLSIADALLRTAMNKASQIACIP